MDFEHKKTFCPILDVDGVISGGKEFDLDVTLPDDNRDVIYGVVKNCFKEPVHDAVVKLVEIVHEHGKEERKAIGHTFTDKEGEFVFGPLCPGKDYAVQIWVNDTKNFKICAKCHHEGKCLKGEKHDKCDCFIDKKDEKYEDYYKFDKDDKYEKDYEDKKYEEYDKHEKNYKDEKYEKEDKECKCEKNDK